MNNSSNLGLSIRRQMLLNRAKKGRETELRFAAIEQETSETLQWHINHVKLFYPLALLACTSFALQSLRQRG